MPERKKACLIAAPGLGDYIAFGYPALVRIGQSHPDTTLVLTENCRGLAEYLGSYSRAFFLPAQKYSGPAVLNGIFESLGLDCVFYNFGLNRAVCGCLDKLASSGAEVKGVLTRDGVISGNSFAMDEISYWRDGRLPPGSPSSQISRRDRILSIMDLPLFGSEFLPFGLFKERRGPLPDSKLVILEPKAGWASKNYLREVELRALFMSAGFDLYTPSVECPPFETLFEKMSRAAAVVSADTFVSNVSLYAGIPTLALCGATDPREIGFEDWIFARPACAPCGETKCGRLGDNANCLSLLSPEMIFNSAARLIRTGRAGVMRKTVKVTFPPPDVKGKNVHVFSLGDPRAAIRFAAPLAEAFSRMGANVSSHVHPAAAFFAGGTFQSGTPAAENIDAAYFLSVSGPDAALAKQLKGSGRAWFAEYAEAFGKHSGPSAAWENLYDREKTTERLFDIIGIPAEARPAAIPPRRTQRPENGVKPLIALDCGSAGLPAMTYSRADELANILSADFSLFRAERAKSFSELLETLAGCSAALVTNGLILDMAVALGVPTLLIEGPLWQSSTAAPYIIPETRLGEFPRPARDAKLHDGSFINSFSPDFLAAEFKAFTLSADKARWLNPSAALWL